MVARGAAALLVVVLAVAAGRVSSSGAGDGPRLTTVEAGSHALVPVLRPASNPTAAAPTPTLLPHASAPSPAGAAWGASLLIGIATLLRADRVRRWRARLVGAPPSPLRFRPH